MDNKYGPGNESSPILLENVQCDGTESSLAECPHDGWGKHNCAHNEDVSISCDPIGECDSDIKP